MTWKMTLQIAVLLLVSTFCGITLMLIHRGDTDDAIRILKGAGTGVLFLAIIVGVGWFFKKMIDDI